MAQQSLVSQDFLFIEASRSQSDTPHSVGLLWPSDNPDAETSTWQHTTLTTDRPPHAPDGIRTLNPRKKGAAGPPRGHWDRLITPLVATKLFFKYIQHCTVYTGHWNMPHFPTPPSENKSSLNPLRERDEFFVTEFSLNDCYQLTTNSQIWQ